MSPLARAWQAIAALGLLWPAPLPAQVQGPWAEVVEQARGQTVYFNAWGGDSRINDYIAWVAEQVEERHGLELVHVKLGDTSEAVGRVVAEKAAGRTEGGSVDLIWINGPNFAAMKEADLLFGPFARRLPGFALVDTRGKPTTLVDFTVPTEGLESPWGMAQFVFVYDSAFVPDPPRSIAALGQWIEAHPGRFTYPQPPDFVGLTFLKHVLLELAPDKAALDRPVEALGPEVVEATLAPLWRWLDAVRPSLWRDGLIYPVSGPAQHRLLNDGEIDFSLAFNPAEASRLVLNGELPESVRTSVLDEGTIANTHFVAIPFNAAHKAGAMVVADFLLSPEAQARKLDPSIWGDGTVLALDRLPPEARAAFEAVPRHEATLPPEALLPVRAEPHPSWMTLIEEEWRQRYGG